MWMIPFLLYSIIWEYIDNLEGKKIGVYIEC